jgi:hypothetical protein
MMMVTTVVFVGTLLLMNTQNTVTHEVNVGQAVSISTAGLVEGLSWFRRQSTQPVTSFAPVRDLAAVPVVNETDDPNIGIVREFEISESNGLWGRYELRIWGGRTTDNKKAVVRDVSIERNLIPTETSYGNGWAWYIKSVGLIFKKANPTTYATSSFYLSPSSMTNPPNLLYKINTDAVTVMSSATTSTEIRRMVIQPPAGGGALCSRRGDKVTVGSKGRIDGGNTKPGIVYPTNTGTPTVSSSGELFGTPTKYSVSPDTDYKDAVTDVFGGMTNTDLKTTADIYSENVSALPAQLPEFSLVYFKGNPTFTSTHPLRGTGILFVEGNLTIDSNSNSMYSGIIYVQGNFVQYAPSVMKGIVIVTGTTSISGIGDFAEVDYDKDIFNQVLAFMGQYRFSKPITFLSSAD